MYLVRSTFSLRYYYWVLVLAYFHICAIGHLHHVGLAFVQLLLVERALPDHHPDLGLVVYLL